MENIKDHELEPFESLEGKMLIATPALDGSVFEKALIFVCAHDFEGAIGVIFNKQVDSISRKDILELYDQSTKFKIDKKYPVFHGGPVDEDKAVILSATKEQKGSFKTLQRLTLYTNADAFMRDAAFGKIKDDFIFANGVCGWAPGQIEMEIEENSWVVAVPDYKLLFSKRIKNKWEKAVKDLGITNFENLVSYSGSA